MMELASFSRTCFVFSIPFILLLGRSISVIIRISCRCLPLQSLKIVVQVELGGENDTSYEMLHEVGWTQVEIFDSFNRVITGRYRIYFLAIAMSFGREQPLCLHYLYLGSL